MKRILFVDDDAQLLEALRLRLRPRSRNWHASFAATADEAVGILERQAQDVVVSGLNGAQLLQSVGERWPQAVRIALASTDDPHRGMQLLPFAHQYVARTCPPQQLEQIIERCLKLQEVLAEPGLRTLIGRIRQLPAQPRIFARLQVVMANENVAPRDIGRIITADAVITAKVLQIANSAFFRRARRITNIEQAVMYLGFPGVRNLVMCAEVFARWPGKLSHAALDLDLLQLHVQQVASVAAVLTVGTRWSDDSVLAALLHDIGYWVLIQECPRELEQAVELAITQGIPMHIAETRLMGASHAELGAYLLGLWGLPYSVIEAVAHHHDPARPQAAQFDVLAALAVSIALSGTDDTDAFRSGPPRSGVVGPDFLLGLEAPFGWGEAEARAAGCLAKLERESAQRGGISRA
ncbi:MAG TPA: response regulator [Steroidobacteraceae bacterium]|nr:response regulator [Steroidobacteraceae bacterium]